jgi:hypothetical protein
MELKRPEDGDGMFPRDVVIHVQVHKAPQLVANIDKIII